MRLAFSTAVVVSSVLLLACASGSQDVNDPGPGAVGGSGNAGTTSAGGKAGSASSVGHGDAGTGGLGGKSGVAGKGGSSTGGGGTSGTSGKGGASGTGGTGGKGGASGAGGTGGAGGTSGKGGASGKGGQAGAGGSDAAGAGGSAAAGAGGVASGGAGGGAAGGMTGGGAANCAHDACVEGVALDPKCSSTVKILCDYDDFCCDSANGTWDSTCASYGASLVGCGGEEAGVLACSDTLSFAWKTKDCAACYQDCLEESGQTTYCDYDFYDSEDECWSYCGNDDVCVCGCAALFQPKALGCSDANDDIGCCAASAKAYTCIASKCASKC